LPLLRRQLQTALKKLGKWTIEIVKRVQTTPDFHLIKRRWVVERTIAWLNRNRRLAKDFEASIESALDWPMIASVKVLTRHLARA
jgi:transposase